MSETLETIRSLGSVEEMQKAAASRLRPATAPKSNSHIHLPPNFSAFKDVQQAVSLAAAQGVGVLGLSNYYDYRVYRDFVAACRRANIFPTFGLEIIALDEPMAAAGIKVNDPGNPGRFYICGKGITKFDPMDPVAGGIINTIRGNDTARMREMIGKIDAIFARGGVDLHLGEQDVIAMVVRRHGCAAEAVTLQERHVCQAFQEAFFARTKAQERPALLEKIFGAACKAKPEDAVGVQGEIRTHLMKAGKPAFVTETFVSFAEAYRLILALGGIPCYPTLADGANPICQYEQPVEQLIQNCRDRNIHMAELIPIRNEPDVFARFVTAYRKAGIPVVAGTEHNTLDLIGMWPTCKGGKAMPAEVLDILWEGTCVMAAHQFLASHGRAGYVDAGGKPNADYAGAEDRIRAFASLGAAVIETYFRSAQGR
ncbi:MAG: hypothetical protein LLG01_01820 [Planctomycetaceae bacterium]|nr:hypothetical protein [Planctomycetaceae bacterium]